MKERSDIHNYSIFDLQFSIKSAVRPQDDFDASILPAACFGGVRRHRTVKTVTAHGQSFGLDPGNLLEESDNSRRPGG
jgi:hypothetical protein